MGTAGPIGGKRIGVEPKVWRSVPLPWRSVLVKRIKQELKMWANMWQRVGITQWRKVRITPR